ncbi:unnamed protein product [Brassicogethes aeneus]|uniref:Generative cell specific-1/HAP2 domain-containing protein n=1 Tax=Brassicogethes aeneus TaxID=1431903 RepID=A0A9P0B0T0_BRAAE|nr:unnamed protein product [Brassicogethes aeneus]
MKIKLTVKIFNKGITNTKNQYIIIDHVFDELTEKKQRLLTPYVIKIKQMPVLQMYPLHFEHLVNSAVREKIYNKNCKQFKGCSTDPNNNPTCKVVIYKEQVIPFSTGFCCSCDPKKNREMEEMEGECQAKSAFPIRPKTSNQSDQDAGTSQRDNENYNKRDIPEKMTSSKDFNSNDKGLKNVNPQIRGGQDCNDCFTPPSANKATYHQSAHCLDFSDLWYSVYRMSEPSIKHSLTIELFEKHEESCGNTHWKDLTLATPLRVGTEKTAKQYNLDGTMSVWYEPTASESTQFSLCHEAQRILIPDSNKDEMSNMPQIKMGADAYLVLKKEQISRNGKKCDVAGVGYEAFFKQPNRCGVPRDTCLKNQPEDMFRRDYEALKKNKKGCNFLRFFGTLPPTPIIEKREDAQNKTLLMNFLEMHTSELYIEFKADQNVVIRPDLFAIITEVYIEATSGRSATITVKVTNSGLVSSVYYVGLSQCPMELPAYLNNLITQPALIAPQHQHIFNLEVSLDLPKSAFHCTVQVVNVKEEVIAYRRIRIQSKDRCLCSWYCSCACFNADGGLKCKELPLDAYLGAGFQGGFPMSLRVVQYTFLDDMISMMLYIIIFLCVILLVLGLIKGLVGLYININIGLWGLDAILDLPKPMARYYESSLRNMKVQYDIYGWPIHPDTKERVRNTAIVTELCLNLIFFFIFPLAVCCIICKRIWFVRNNNDRGYESTQTNNSDFCKCN